MHITVYMSVWSCFASNNALLMHSFVLVWIPIATSVSGLWDSDLKQKKPLAQLVLSFLMYFVNKYNCKLSNYKSALESKEIDLKIYISCLHFSIELTS